MAAAMVVTTVAPRVETIPNPNAAQAYWFCRPATLNFGYCFNALMRSKNPQQPLRILVQPGTYQLVEGMVVIDADQVEVVGVADAQGNFPELLSANSSLGRLAHQYFSFLVINSTNVAIENLRLNGADILGQRAIGICATPDPVKKIANISLNHLSLSRFQGFNIMVGESLTTEHIEKIAGYLYYPQEPLWPMKAWAKQAVDDGKAFCGGSYSNVSLTESEVKMKSVAFYLTPPFAKMSDNIIIGSPLDSGVPQWYAQRAEKAQQISGVEVAHNRFIAENLTDTQYDPRNFHSVIKLHNTVHAKVANNFIDLSPLQQLNPSRIIVGINVASGVIDSEIKNNEIKYPAHLRSRFAVNLQVAIEGHVTYGFGDKALFGSVSGVKVESNSIQNGVIRFSDCSVFESQALIDYRPYTQQLNELVRSRQLRERILLAYNSENGQPNRDANLIWRQGVNEPTWKSGKSAIYCRDSFDVRVVTGNGTVR